MKFKFVALLVALAVVLVSATAFPVKADQNSVNVGSASCCRTVKLFDVEDVRILAVETDLTPVHTIRSQNGFAVIVNGWGWIFGYKYDWPSSETIMLEPLGILVSEGKASFRESVKWGIPGDVVQASIGNTEPKEGFNFHTFYSVAGRTSVKIIRAAVNIWSANGRTYLHTGQIAVGEAVPVDENFYSESPTPTLTKNVNLNRDLVNGGTISGIHIVKVESYTNNSGWLVTQWKVDRVTIKTKGGASLVFSGSLNLLEPNPNTDEGWYPKWFKEVWNPARLIGKNVCPYVDAIPAIQTVYLWDGSCE